MSDVVRGGRTYLQGSLSQFKGLIVEWDRAVVRCADGHAWKSMTVDESFWRDLEWWQERMLSNQ